MIYEIKWKRKKRTTIYKMIHNRTKKYESSKTSYGLYIF
jgi:hypothetical protein